MEDDMWEWIKNSAAKAWDAVKGAASVIGRFVVLVVFRLLKGLELLGSFILRLRWRKYMEVSVIVLVDAKGTPIADAAAVQAVVDRAVTTFRRQMNIRLRPPHNEDEIVRVWDIALDGPVPSYVLYPKCDGGAFRHIFTRMGVWYAAHSAIEGVTIYVVADVQEKNGCHLGPWADWGYIDPNAIYDDVVNKVLATDGRQLTLAHEFGHACQLLDRGRGSNTLMRGHHAGRPPRLTRWQRAWARSSWHVHYFA